MGEGDRPKGGGGGGLRPPSFKNYGLSRRLHVTLPLRESRSRGLNRGLAAITGSRNQPRSGGKLCETDDSSNSTPQRS
jgi:hypothetical protein